MTETPPTLTKYIAVLGTEGQCSNPAGMPAGCREPLPGGQRLRQPGRDDLGLDRHQAIQAIIQGPVQVYWAVQVI